MEDVSVALGNLKTEILGFSDAHRAELDRMKAQLNRLALGGGFNFGPGGGVEALTGASSGLPIGLVRNPRPQAMMPDPGAVAAFKDYLSGGFRAAGQVGQDSRGGLLVPDFVSVEIRMVGHDLSPVRQFARLAIIEAGKGDAYIEPVDHGSAEVAWEGETQTPGETDEGELAQARIPLHELRAMPAATQKLLDTATFDVSSWYMRKVTRDFLRAENAAFVTGNGVGRPRGFLTYPMSVLGDSARPWGEVEQVLTGVSGAFPAPSLSPQSHPLDLLVDLVSTLKAVYRPGAAWWMNRSTAGVIRKFKDANNLPVWSPAVVAGQPDALLGFPVILADDMPDIAANSLSVALANLAECYTVVDHQAGVKLLVDPFTAKPKVRFYTVKKVGGGVVNFEAIKVLRFAAP